MDKNRILDEGRTGEGAQSFHFFMPPGLKGLVQEIVSYIDHLPLTTTNRALYRVVTVRE